MLIVTAWYAPLIHPRAHRWTALAAYWAAQGWEVTVVTAGQAEAPAEATQQGVRIYRVGADSLKGWFFRWFGRAQARGQIGRTPQTPGWGMRFLMTLYRHIWQRLFFPDDSIIWYFPAKKKVFQLLKQTNFDAIITVSLPMAGHLIGLRVKKHAPHLRWIADIGDPFSFQQPPLNNTRLYGRASSQLEQQILTTAGAVTVTTPATKALYTQYFGASCAENIQVIPPLFTQVYDFEQIVPDQEFRLCYFGSFYAGVRTPAPLLALLECTRKYRPALAGQLEIGLYGDIAPELIPHLSDPAIQLKGLYSRQDAQSAMQKAPALIHIGNKSTTQLPSKIVDYLAAGRPVVHLAWSENDPFEQTWGKQPGLLTLVFDGKGYSDSDIEKWLQWLDQRGWQTPSVDIATRNQRILPYRIDRIANGYAQLI